MRTSPTVTVIVTLTLTLAAACSKQGGGGAEPGKERGPCYGNRTCDEGLVCLSDLCVAPPAADCAKVAEHLSYLLLGNYAPREERAAYVAGVHSECTAMRLSKEDGDCLLRAEGRQSIGQCARPLGVGDCTKIVTHLKSILPSGGPDPWLVTEADRFIARCKNEVPSKALETCVLGVKTPKDLARCTW
jgi:hypothetical protein